MTTGRQPSRIIFLRIGVGIGIGIEKISRRAAEAAENCIREIDVIRGLNPENVNRG